MRQVHLIAQALVTYMQLEAYLVEIDLDAIDPLHYVFAVHPPGHLMRHTLDGLA